MAGEGADRLFGEVDLRLTQQGERADALATRSGVMVAAIAVAASLLAGRLPTGHGHGWFIASIVLLGLSVVAGLLVLCMARLSFGPDTTQLVVWASSSPTEASMGALFAAKASTVEANQSTLARVEVVFYVQALTAGLATGAVLYAVGRFG